MKLKTWKEFITSERFTQILQELYGPCESSRLEAERERYASLLERFSEFYEVTEDEEVLLFSAPGRSEISGNHTDHQHGRVLACSVNLDIIAAARRIAEPVIRVKSYEFAKTDEVDVADLSVRPDETESSAALIRGIAAQLKERGYPVGGCEIYTMSDVPKGSGLSSSAAFEIVVLSALDQLFGDGNLPPLERAKIAQYAENRYFGKPSGLLDQSASAVGGLIALDFADPTEPELHKLDVNFSDFGYDLLITRCPGDHADLTDEYAAVPREMRAVANVLGEEVLRAVPFERFIEALPSLHGEVSDRALLRAFHFLTEDARIPSLVTALEEGDVETFLDGILRSGRSSWMYLQNLYPDKSPEHQSLCLGLMLSEKLLTGDGAWRVHGGGFAGTIQAFVPHEKVETYRRSLDALFGEGSCQVLNIRPHGAVCLDTL